MTITLSKNDQREVETFSGGSTQEYLPFTVDPSSMNHLLEALIKSYDNPAEAAVRELISNAVDSTVEAGSGESITVSLPKKIFPYLVVEDHGLGMSMDTLNYIYRSFGNSTKTDNYSLIGSKGMGSKAPLAVSDSFTIETNHEGIKTIASVEQSKNGGGLTILLSEPTGDPNGTKITVPISEKLIDSFEDILKKNNYYFTVPVIVDGKDINRDFSQMQSFTKIIDGHEITYRVDIKNIGEVSFNVGGIIYKVQHKNAPKYWSYIIDLPIGSVTFPTSRDSIEMSEKSINTFDSVLVEANPDAVVWDLIDGDEDSMGHMDFVSKWFDVINNYSTINKYNYSSFTFSSLDKYEYTLYIHKFNKGPKSLLGLNTEHGRGSMYDVDLGARMYRLTEYIRTCDLILFRDEVESLGGINSTKLLSVITELNKYTYRTYDVLVLEDTDLKTIIPPNVKTFEDFGDIEATYSKYKEDLKEYRRSRRKPAKKSLGVNQVKLFTKDSKKLVDLNDLEGTYYYERVTASKIDEDSSPWYSKELFNLKHPVLQISSRKSLKSIKHIKLLSLEEVFKDFTKSAKMKYLLGLYNNEGLFGIKNVLNHYDYFLDNKNTFKLGKLRAPLQKMDRYLKECGITWGEVKDVSLVFQDLGFYNTMVQWAPKDWVMLDVYSKFCASGYLSSNLGMITKSKAKTVCFIVNNVLG